MKKNILTEKNSTKKKRIKVINKHG